MMELSKLTSVFDNFGLSEFGRRDQNSTFTFEYSSSGTKVLLESLVEEITLVVMEK